jgi:hypothetical protein
MPPFLFRACLHSALLALGLCPAGAVIAQDRDSDSLDRVKKQVDVAAQKTEADVRLAVRSTVHLAATDPAGAAEKLRYVLDNVDNDPNLSDSRRAALRHMIQDRIRVLALRDDPARAADDKKALLAGRRRDDVQAPTGEETTKRLMKGIKRLQKEGKLAESDRQAAELAARKPDSPAAQALQRTTSTANQLAANRDIREGIDRGASDSLRGVDRSAVAGGEDITYPRDWKQRTGSRKSSNYVPLTARERSILKALDSPVSARFENSRFEDVIEYLQTMTGLPIAVSKAALEEAGVTYDSPVTLRVKGVTARFALRKLLADLDLGYVIRNESLEVVTAAQARENMVTRVHYIGDLLFGGPIHRAWQAAQLMELIQDTVDPQSWQGKAGAGSIFYDDARRALVIKQNAELQPVLSSGLR